MFSTYAFITMNLLEKVEASTVVCCLLYHIMGERLRNIINPVRDLRVTLCAACEVSTYAIVVTKTPRGLGEI